MSKSFEDYTSEKREWVSVLDTPFYPDILEEATVYYKPVLEKFKEVVMVASSSEDVYRRLAEGTNGKLWDNCLAVFRRYIAPSAAVEIMKRKKDVEANIKSFGSSFRDIKDVRAKLISRPSLDEALIVSLNEYRSRGKKGYDFTELFFEWFEENFGEVYEIKGPRRAGKDLDLRKILPGLTTDVPTDFAIFHKKSGRLAVVGYARYDSDRGGAQADDRTGGNKEKINIIQKYAREYETIIRVLFLNDGPGLIAGEMWREYVMTENTDRENVMVCTFKMLDERFIPAWFDPISN